jgi:hypothetical protein
MEIWILAWNTITAIFYTSLNNETGNYRENKLLASQQYALSQIDFEMFVILVFSGTI